MGGWLELPWVGVLGSLTIGRVRPVAQTSQRSTKKLATLRPMSHRAHPPQRARPLAGLLLALPLALAVDTDVLAAAAGVVPPVLLVPGTSVERSLKAGAIDLYDADLAAGSPWRIRVEQLGVDVIVEVKGPDGQSLLTVANPTGREGRESLLLIPGLLASAGSAIYRVEVRSEKPGAPDGH